MPSAIDLPRRSLGIPGLDRVLRGGIPRDSFFLVQGPPGSGKTTIGLQFLLHGIAGGETCLLASNAETPAQLASLAATHGWSLEGIHLIDWADGSGGDEDADDSEAYTLFPEEEVELGQALARFFGEIQRLRPQRVVIDSISGLRSLAPSAAFYRRQIKRIRDFLNAHSCTTLIVDDAHLDEADVRAQTLAGGLLDLEHPALQYGGERRRLRVRKLRGSAYLGGFHDFTIETGGVRVYPRLVALEHGEVPSGEPARSGLDALDGLAGGGLPRGSTTLFLGPSGSGKSTLAATYLHAAAQRGERCAVYLFDEHPGTYLERARALGIDLTGPVADGRVLVRDLDPAELTPGQIAHHLVEQVEERGVGLTIVDSLNGYLQSATEEPMVFLHLRELLSFLSRRGVVTLLTLTQHGFVGNQAPPLDISFLADNVFVLRFFDSQGSVRKAVAMLKKRAGGHEHSIREMRLAEGRGIELGEPLAEFSGVLGPSPLRTSPGRGPGTS